MKPLAVLDGIHFLYKITHFGSVEEIFTTFFLKIPESCETRASCEGQEPGRRRQAGREEGRGGEDGGLKQRTKKTKAE